MGKQHIWRYLCNICTKIELQGCGLLASFESKANIPQFSCTSLMFLSMTVFVLKKLQWKKCWGVNAPGSSRDAHPLLCLFFVCAQGMVSDRKQTAFQSFETSRVSNGMRLNNSSCLGAQPYQTWAQRCWTRSSASAQNMASVVITQFESLSHTQSYFGLGHEHPSLWCLQTASTENTNSFFRTVLCAKTPTFCGNTHTCKPHISNEKKREPWSLVALVHIWGPHPSVKTWKNVYFPWKGMLYFKVFKTQFHTPAVCVDCIF